MERDSREMMGYVLVFVSGVIWGFIGPLMKLMSINGAETLTVAFLRMLFGFIILAPAALSKCGIRAFRISPRALGVSILLGLISQGIYNMARAHAVATIGVTSSAILLNVAPIFGLLSSILFFSERATWVKIIAIFLDIAGCVLVVKNGQLTGLGLSVLGVACGLLSGLCYSLAAPLTRIATQDADPFVVNTYAFGFAVLFLGITLPLSGETVVLNTPVLLGGLLLGLFPTALTYVIFSEGVRRITATSKVPVISSVETIVAAMFGFFAYHEPLGPASIVGIVIVLVSIAMMGSGGNGHTEKRKPTEPTTTVQQRMH